MSSSINPEYRLRNLKRRLTDLLMSRRLAANSEATGVVELGDFGKKCDRLADFAAESLKELNAARGTEARCAARIAEEVELAARLCARIETLPRSAGNIHLQCDLLEEPTQKLDAALRVELLLEEPPVRMGLGPFAESERDLFEEFLEFTVRDCRDRLVPVPHLQQQRAADNGSKNKQNAETRSGYPLFGLRRTIHGAFSKIVTPPTRVRSTRMSRRSPLCSSGLSDKITRSACLPGSMESIGTTGVSRCVVKRSPSFAALAAGLIRAARSGPMKMSRWRSSQ